MTAESLNAFVQTNAVAHTGIINERKELPMTQKQPDKYNTENMIRYKTAIAAIDSLVTQGLFTMKDKAEMCKIIDKKYGFNSCSIFAS